MSKELRIKQCLEYCEYAAEKLRNAGFKLNYTSMKSEACYYEHPARKGYTIRIAAHRYGRTEDRMLPHHIGKTIACITFSPGNFNELPKSWDSIDKIIFMAVGQYFVKDLPARLRDHAPTLRREREPSPASACPPEEAVPPSEQQENDR